MKVWELKDVQQRDIVSRDSVYTDSYDVIFSIPCRARSNYQTTKRNLLFILSIDSFEFQIIVERQLTFQTKEENLSYYIIFISRLYHLVHIEEE